MDNEEFLDAVVEAKEIEMTPGAKALKAYRDNLTPEQKAKNVAKAQKTRKENTEKKREIEVAVRYLMNQRYQMKKPNGETVFGTGYDLRAKALFEEVIGHGKNMIGAEKQLSSYLGEEKEANTAANTVTVVFQQGQELDV